MNGHNCTVHVKPIFFFFFFNSIAITIKEVMMAALLFLHQIMVTCIFLIQNLLFVQISHAAALSSQAFFL